MQTKSQFAPTSQTEADSCLNRKQNSMWNRNNQQPNIVHLCCIEVQSQLKLVSQS